MDNPLVKGPLARHMDEGLFRWGDPFFDGGHQTDFHVMNLRYHTSPQSTHQYLQFGHFDINNKNFQVKPITLKKPTILKCVVGQPSKQTLSFIFLDEKAKSSLPKVPLSPQAQISFLIGGQNKSGHIFQNSKLILIKGCLFNLRK